MPQAVPSLTTATRLDEWGVIRASGADAASFLHSQLTQDIAGMAIGQGCLAGFCSAKGRLQATFVVQREAAEDYLLACSRDLLPAVLKRLRMFVLRARCHLVDASAERAAWGLTGKPFEPSVDAVRLPESLVDGERVGRALRLAPALETLASAAPSDPDLWAWLEVFSATPRIVAATSELFVPQMVNLDLVGGVSFQKGCYPGQEVVARSQYRGTLKRRGFIARCAVPLRPAQDVFADVDPEQPAGQVVLAAMFDGQHAAFVELKLTSAGEAVRTADGAPLVLAPMPYTLPGAPVVEAASTR